MAAEGWEAPSRYGALLNVPFVEQRRAEIAALAHVNGALVGVGVRVRARVSAAFAHVNGTLPPRAASLPPRTASLPPRVTSVTNYHPWPHPLACGLSPLAVPRAPAPPPPHAPAAAHHAPLTLPALTRHP